jgi:hypothetical protein
MKAEPEILAYFPLSVFLFPGEDLPLRIFEPRYQQLIGDVRSTGMTFVIPFVIEQEVQGFGCEVILKEVVAENPGGRMVITVESLDIVQIISYYKRMNGKLYPGGAISRMPESELLENQELIELISNYQDVFDNEFLNCCDRSQITRQDVIKALNLPSEDKFHFACLPNGAQKDAYLIGQLRYLNMIRQQEMQLGNDFGLN